MEWRLLFFLAAVLAPSDSACPNACDCHDRLVKCTSYIPDVAQLNLLAFEAPSANESVSSLWLDNVDRTDLEQHYHDVNCSQPNFYCHKLETISLSKYSWMKNQSAAFAIMTSFLSNLPKLKSLNISYNDFESIEWCKNINAPNVVSFNASHNKIYNMDYDTFQGMSQLSELVLADNQLHELKQAFDRLNKLQLLDLSNNRILKLNRVLKSMPDLRRLNLAGNKISFIPVDYFQDLRSLVELDISRNAFVFIRAESLQWLTSLSLLNLSENRLIERDLSLLLDSVRRLEVVDASRIGLWRVPATLTRSVKIMRLVGNQLTAIDSGDFESYPLLKLLDLSGNKLISIEDDALGRLDDLEQLNLYGNILSSVPKSLPSKLKMLDLRQNTIAAVNANDLHGLGELEKLDLSGNVISCIDNGAFRHLTSLRELDISDNPIKRLTSDALSGPPALSRLRMAGLTEFKLDENQNQDTAFPYSTPEYLVHLDLSRSSSLAALFLADNATLSACKELKLLDLSNTNISSIRSDLYYVLPELQKVLLFGNEFNCKKWQEQAVECREHEYVSFEWKRWKESREKRLLSKQNSHVLTTTIPQRQETTTIRILTEESHSTTVTKIIDVSEKKGFEITVKPTVTPPATSSPSEKYATTTDMPATKGEDKISTTQSVRTLTTSVQSQAKIPVVHDEQTTQSTVPVTEQSSTYIGEERPDLFILRESKPSKTKVVNKKPTKKQSLKTTPVEDNQNSDTTTRMPSTAKLELKNEYESKTTKATITTEEEDIISTTEEDQPAIINLGIDMTTTVYEESLKSSNHMFSEFSRSKVLLANDEEEQASAEELTNEPSQRNSEFHTSGAHPGMLILVGAVIGAAAALTVVLSRRATAKGRERYQRQENIEVHALTPTTELW